ncbi:MAG: 1,4-alpha-glucan branching protein GlgB [Armatimonadetes bacterium]|nr:1,4-alpha-glucan branching protein GlgB [Anaerolineae bacterium]
MSMDALLPGALNALAHGVHGAPFQVLGAHPITATSTVIRAMQPTASQLNVLLADGERLPMTRILPEGVYEVIVQRALADVRYQYELVDMDGVAQTLHDPYIPRPSLFAELDLYLLREGNHLESYTRLGAHPRTVDAVAGVNFAVWAPNALRISVISDFNAWDERVHPMQMIGDSGIWELFIPGVQPGAVYRYDLLSQVDGYRVRKADPYAFYTEMRPNNASVVADLDGYAWGDDAWMTARRDRNPLTQPMATYEAHLGSWKRTPENTWLTYRDLAADLVPYLSAMGYTHLELLPIAEHPFDGSWGYQVTGYYAATSRYGTPHDLMYLVDVCHQHNIGVILDWVPAHFPKDAHGLAYFDGTHLYEHADPRQAEHPDWGTYIFNYGRTEVRNFLIANALFWLKTYHIDGLRVDAVSSILYLDFSRKAGQWVANRYGGNENLEAVEFVKAFNEIVHRECPGAMTIAEESTSWARVSRPLYVGGLGFTFKWNMGWMHDTLKYVQDNPIHRRYHHNQITFSLFYAFSENFVLALSHDEVVHGKGSLINKASGDWWQKFATLRLLFGYQYTHPGKKLTFMGQEIGQWREWSEERGLDWELLGLETHQRLQAWVRDLNHFYVAQPALYEHDFDDSGFKWIEANDSDQSVFSYIRFADNPNDLLIVVCNFTPVPRQGYRIGVPAAGRYLEALNSDSAYYGGGNVGNGGAVTADATPSHAWDYSVVLTLPPLAILVLKPEMIVTPITPSEETGTLIQANLNPSDAP